MLLVACRSPWYPPSNDLAPEARVVVIDEVPQRPHIVYQVLHADTYLEGGVASTLRGLVDAAQREARHECRRRAAAAAGARSMTTAARAEADADEAKAAENTEEDHAAAFW